MKPSPYSASLRTLQSNRRLFQHEQMEISFLLSLLRHVGYETRWDMQGSDDYVLVHLISDVGWVTRAWEPAQRLAERFDYVITISTFGGFFTAFRQYSHCFVTLSTKPDYPPPDLQAEFL